MELGGGGRDCFAEQQPGWCWTGIVVQGLAGGELAKQFSFHFREADDFHVDGGVVRERGSAAGPVDKWSAETSAPRAAPGAAVISTEADRTTVGDADGRIDPEKGLGGELDRNSKSGLSLQAGGRPGKQR